VAVIHRSSPLTAYEIRDVQKQFSRIGFKAIDHKHWLADFIRISGPKLSVRLI
jgi:hypothetical protein